MPTDAASDRQLTFAGCRRLTGLVKCNQGGGTGRVQRHARSAQIEHVGNSIGGDTGRIAGRHGGIDGPQIVGEAVRVIGARYADIDAAFAALDRTRLDTGVFKRLPAHLQQQALLRIHLRRLPRRDTEETGIKSGYIANGTGRVGITGAGVALARMAERLLRPTCRIDRRDQILAAQKIGPILLRAGSGKAEGHADDGNFSFHRDERFLDNMICIPKVADDNPLYFAAVGRGDGEVGFYPDHGNKTRLTGRYWLSRPRTWITSV